MSSATREAGFTLVELMVVVLIIGILISVAIPVFQISKVEVQKKSCFANERTVEGAFAAYVAQAGSSAAVTDTNSLFAALVPLYIQSKPKCPAGGTYTWHLSGELDCDVAGHFHYN